MTSNEDEKNPQWRELVTVSDDAEARLIEGRLESEGIECQIESLVFTQEPVQFGLLGGVRVHVLAHDFDRAARLLDELRDRSAGEVSGPEEDGPEAGGPREGEGVEGEAPEGES